MWLPMRSQFQKNNPGRGHTFRTMIPERKCRFINFFQDWSNKRKEKWLWHCYFILFQERYWVCNILFQGRSCFAYTFPLSSSKVDLRSATLMKMYHKVLTVVCCATHTRLGVKVIDSSCSCAIPITDAALRTEFFLFASSSTIGGTYEETKIRNHSAIYRICGKAESFHLQLHLALILVSCFFFFSCFLLCFVFNWYMQMNVGVSPITAKLFENNSVV